jgi:hypothetical protein
MSYKKSDERKRAAVFAYNLARLVKATKRKLKGDTAPPSDQELIDSEMAAADAYWSRDANKTAILRELKGFDRETGEPPTEIDPETGQRRIAVDPKTGKQWTPSRLDPADVAKRIASNEALGKFRSNVLAPSSERFTKPRKYRSFKKKS